MTKISFIFVFGLLSVFCFSSVSYSNNDYKLLMKYKNDLISNNSMMRVNNNDLMKTIKSTKYTGYDIYSKFGNIKDELLWSSDMITFFSMTYRLRYHQNRMIMNRLIFIQELLQIDLTLINKQIYYITVDSLMQILDKQKDIILSSIETLDKTIKLMKRMTRNQSRNKSK